MNIKIDNLDLIVKGDKLLYEPFIRDKKDDKDIKLYLENGWGISIVKNNFSYGHEDGLWEICLLHKTSWLDSFKIANNFVHNNAHFFPNPVRGWVSPKQIQEFVDCMYFWQENNDDFITSNEIIEVNYLVPNWCFPDEGIEENWTCLDDPFKD